MEERLLPKHVTDIYIPLRNLGIGPGAKPDDIMVREST